MAGWNGQPTKGAKGTRWARWIDVVRDAAVKFWKLLPQFIGGFVGLWLLYVLAMWITSLIGGG